MSVSVSIWIYNDQLHKKGPELVIMVPRSFLRWKMIVKVVEAIEVVEAAKVNEAA